MNKALNFYKKHISHSFVILFGHSCRFTPTCSEYTSEAVHKYGIVKGGFFAARRVISCNPFGKSGYDPLI
jgi:putative membrane protein insertion efficiency factor